jgi:glucose/arabinose dehydrogenase
MTVGPDGALYAATFTGFPHPKGEARVYRMKDLNADGDALDDGESTVVATGLTAATDVTFDAKGSMLVSEYSTDMFKGTLGRIARIVDGEPVSLVRALQTPTSIAVTDDGRLLVTEEAAGRVTDVTNAPVGGFSTDVTSGVNLVAYGGGPVAMLEIEATEVRATAIATSGGGKFIVFIPGAPAFVNKAFTARYPTEVPAGTLLVIVAK